MRTSTKAMPLLLEFVGSLATATVFYAALSRSGVPLFGAIGVGIVYAAFVAIGRPYYVVQINPIVTIGLWMARKLSTIRSFVTILVQMLGSVAAWRLTEVILDRPLQPLANGEFDWQIFAAEAVGAFVFTFILSTVLYREKLEETKLIFVAFASVTVGMIIASLASKGYGLISPSLAAGIQSWNWTFVLAPIAGGFVGMSLIPFIDMLDSKGAKLKKKPAKKKSKKRK